MWKLLANIFNKFVYIFKRFIAIAIPAAKAIIIAQLKEFAIVMVSKLEVSDLSNEERRKVAFNNIRIEALAKGIKIKDSLVSLIIEISLQYIKEKARK